MIGRLVAIAAVTAFVAGACSLLPGTAASRQPKPCAVVYSVARCDAMTDIVAADIDKNRDDVVSVAIVPDAPPGGVHLSAGWHVRVRIALRDGSIHDKEICGGVVHEPACLDDPRLEIRSTIDAYRDIPEGSSPIPRVDAVSEGRGDPDRACFGVDPHRSRRAPGGRRRRGVDPERHLERRDIRLRRCVARRHRAA